MNFIISFIVFIIGTSLIMLYEFFKFNKLEKIIFAIIGEVFLILSNIINSFFLLPFVSFFLYFEIRMAEGFGSGTNLSLFFNIVTFQFLLTMIPYLIGIVLSFIYNKKYSLKITLFIILFNILHCSIYTIPLIEKLNI